jgi:pyruvate/2-oxoglutarate dehydrogenase complex dihydrolipoamide dehydrogenase (E3) component
MNKRNEDQSERTSADSALAVDLCVIGAGSGGLAVAAAAAQMGARVALVECDKMGGDCLNAGCVPSKALIAAAHVAHAARHGKRFGIDFQPPRVAFGDVHRHVHEVIAAIAPHDSVERFSGLGVQVIKAEGRFTGPRELEAGGRRITARRFVIATGSRASLPPVVGLDTVPYLTNETIFDLTVQPSHLLVLGGGPIGVEMAQAFRRLGARVTLVEQYRLLPRDEPEAVAIVRRVLMHDGVEVIEDAIVSQVRKNNSGVTVVIEGEDTESRIIHGTHLLVSAGRQPNLEGLDLSHAGVAHEPTGIKVDARLRTTNKRIYAIGDVAGGPQFTHVAGYHAGIVIRNALFGLPTKVDYSALPWVIYADPEIAHIGLTEERARSEGHMVSVLIERLAANDRAQTDRRTDGLAKIVLGARGRILGATIVAPHAGELISLWGLAIGQRLKLSAIANMIAPYPTLSEISKKIAASYFTPTVYGKTMKAVVRTIQRFLP